MSFARSGANRTAAFSFCQTVIILFIASGSSNSPHSTVYRQFTISAIPPHLGYKQTSCGHRPKIADRCPLLGSECVAKLVGIPLHREKSAILESERAHL